MHDLPVEEMVDQNEQPLVDFVADTATLSARAASILDAEADRIDRVLTDGLSVLTLVDRNPGAVDALLKGAPQFVNGLASATSTGAFRAPIANFAVLNPGSLLDASGEFGEGQGGAGIGPDIVVEGFPLDLDAKVAIFRRKPNVTDAEILAVWTSNKDAWLRR